MSGSGAAPAPHWRWPTVVYRVFLLTLPAGSRSRYGPSMESDFQRLFSDAWSEHGRWGAVKCLAWEGIDVLGTGLHMRWRLTMMGLGLDLKCAARSLARRKEFSLVAILTLALAIGSSTAMFSVLDGVLFRSLPYNEPDLLVRLITTYQGGTPQPSVY